LVSHGTSVYLVGGFSAENGTGEKSRLESQAGVHQYDLNTQKWIDLPSLPEPRSSMDAAVLDGSIYAIGGWTMNGESSETKWLKTAWRLNLSETDKGWQAIAAPPFERRAIVVVPHAGKLYVIGGMNSEGSPTTECSLYDPSKDQWTEVSNIAGVPMNGFGAAAVDLAGKLMVSTVDGSIQQLNDTTGQWDIVGTVPNGRFFHRALPISSDRFAILGGAHMDVGKFRECQVIHVLP
jgi:N-acetylneuraminic acid mutarotase